VTILLALFLGGALFVALGIFVGRPAIITLGAFLAVLILVGLLADLRAALRDRETMFWRWREWRRE